MEALIHSANVLYLVSYTMRDILWLRVFTVIAACCLIPYFYFQTEPLLAPIYWNLLFIVFGDHNHDGRDLARQHLLRG